MTTLLSALSIASVVASSPQLILDSAQSTNVALKDLDASLDKANAVGPIVNIGLTILCAGLAGRAIHKRIKK